MTTLDSPPTATSTTTDTTTDAAQADSFQSQATPRAGGMQTVDAATAKRWLDAGEAVLIDVREPSEYRAEHIEGATLMPQGSFDPAAAAALAGDKKLVVHCKMGGRGQKACDKAVAAGLSVHNVQGGIEAWKQAGLPTKIDKSAPIDLMRQVQITAGSLILIGAALAVTVNPWFWALPTFIGAGFVFAGVTGTCGMGMMLSKMPWNRVPGGSTGASCCSSGNCSTQ